MNSFDLQTTISSSEICLGDSTFIGMNYVGEDWETISLSWLHCTSCPTNSPLAEYPSEDTFYVASATNTCGEVIYDTIQIEVNPLPIVTLNESLGEVCLGQSIAFEYLNNSNWSYWWDFGDGNYSSEMNPVHTYNYAFSFPVNLSIIDENGCESSSNSGGIANVFPNAEADFGLSNYDVHMLDPTISFYNYSSNADTYFWDFGDNQISSHFEPMHTYDEHGQYVISLEANNIYNCPDTAYLVISVKPAHAIYVPNAFTPDGDDYNNFFMATGYGIDEQGFTLMVYNRWGEIVFESHDMNVGWNGTYGNDSREVKEGVYIWTIQYKDLTNKQHQMEGHVSVLR
jgi:gliding motility-associated-like protein